MTTSPKKLAKIARKTFRKQQDRFFGEAIRPKPRWMPWKVYLFLLGLFIKIEK